MNSTKERLDYLDMARGIGIFLVVLGHLEYIGEPLREWIQSFHMPLFFIMSGMMIQFKGDEGTPFSSILSKKFSSVMIPYISFSILYFIFDYISISVGHITWFQAYQNIVDSVTLYGVSVLWFLPALFFGELFLIAMLKYLPRKYILPLCLLLALCAGAFKKLLEMDMISVYYLHSYFLTCLVNIVKVFIRAVISCFFIAFGYFSMPRLQHLRQSRRTGLFYALLLALVHALTAYINTGVDLHFIVLGNPLLYYTAALSGSYALIYLCRNIRPLKFVCFYGRNSLIVMATHVNAYIVYVGILLAQHINQYVTRAKNYVFCFIILTVIFAIECPLILIINRYLPFMLGRRKTGESRKRNGA